LQWFAAHDYPGLVAPHPAMTVADRVAQVYLIVLFGIAVAKQIGKLAADIPDIPYTQLVTKSTNFFTS